MTRDMPERKAICDGLVPGFDYLEARITGTCDAQYSLVGMYELCDLVRVFDPNFATAHANPALLNRMSVITPLNALDMLDGMKQELPLYLAAGGQLVSADLAIPSTPSRFPTRNAPPSTSSVNNQRSWAWG